VNFQQIANDGEPGGLAKRPECRHSVRCVYKSRHIDRLDQNRVRENRFLGGRSRTSADGNITIFDDVGMKIYGEVPAGART
jgi:hypothetical protein